MSLLSIQIEFRHFIYILYTFKYSIVENFINKNEKFYEFYSCKSDYLFERE